MKLLLWIIVIVALRRSTDLRYNKIISGVVFVFCTFTFIKTKDQINYVIVRGEKLICTVIAAREIMIIQLMTWKK